MHPHKSIDKHPRSRRGLYFLLFMGLAVACAIVVATLSPFHQKLRVACVGDSTTWGTHATRADGVTYPDYLAKLGRRTLQVRNSGVGATTLLRRSGHAWCDTEEFERTIAFHPDIVVIMFGVNEIAHPDLLDGFLPDALWLVGQFSSAIPDVRIFIATPTPLAPAVEQRLKNSELATKIIPVWRQVAQMTGCEVIEVNQSYPPTLDFLPDGIHPNAKGNRLIAELVFNAIQPSNTQP